VQVLAEDGLTHERDDEQDVGGRDVRPDVAASSRCAKESVEGWREVFHEVAREVVERWVARVQSCGESALGADELREPSDSRREGFPRLMLRAEGTP